MKWVNESVIFLIFYILKCAVVADEIEEFSDFLYKTSQLDQILKKGNDFDDDDEELPSDHAWEESGKFEGDIILNDRQRRLLLEEVAEGLSRNGLKDSTKKWPDNEVIYYIQKEHFTDDQIQAIESGIEDIGRASCVKFRPYKRGDRDAVVIQGSRRGCFSQVGYQGGYQVLNLNGRHPVGRGCFRHGTVVHELLHTLGFYHMQSSPDRDEYINVIWDNIIEPAKHNFRKYNSFSVTDFGVGYDYDSVLHYSRRAFSANGKDTLVPKRSGASIGQRIGLSDKDTQKLNKMYCDGGDNNSFDADEETTPKPPLQAKEKPKNKPFEGHGIGYHRGNIVVIKLPAAKTYKITDVPSFHLFDHFSNSPQIVSSPPFEGFGVGQEIENEYNKSPAAVGETLNNISNNFEKGLNANSTKLNRPSRPLPENDKTENREDYSNKTDDDLDEAFERLGKIIKAHVYPSQLPDFSIYNPKEMYKKFETSTEKNLLGNLHEETTDEGLRYDGKEVDNEQKSDDGNHMEHNQDINHNDKSDHEVTDQNETDQDEETGQNNDTYNLSEEIEEKNEDSSIKPNHSGKTDYVSPFSTKHYEPFQFKTIFGNEKYAETTNRDNDDPYPKYSVNDFEKPFNDDFSKSHEAYKQILNDNRIKHNYVNHLPSIKDENHDGPLKPSKQKYKIYGKPIQNNYYKNDISYESSKNTGFR